MVSIVLVGMCKIKVDFKASHAALVSSRCRWLRAKQRKKQQLMFSQSTHCIKKQQISIKWLKDAVSSSKVLR